MSAIIVDNVVACHCESSRVEARALGTRQSPRVLGHEVVK